MFLLHCLTFYLLVSNVYAQTVDFCNSTDSANTVYSCFKQQHPDPIGILTTEAGIPIEKKYTSSLNSNLFRQKFFLDSHLHFINENIPARVHHAQGYGASGVFTMTKKFSGFTRAKLFSAVGKQTPVKVRFSQMNMVEGSPETQRDKHGMAIQFDTEDGIFDLMCVDAPIFAIKDPMHYPGLVHSAYRNPSTTIPDPTMFWDFTLNVPESIYSALYMFSENGLPNGYQHMAAHAVHTYQVENSKGIPSFVRFHLQPDAGIKNMPLANATFLAGTDANYLTRTLFNAIAAGNYPSWTLYAQVLSLKVAQKYSSVFFDVTRKLPEKLFPMREVGKIVLNKNVENYFADVEIAAFQSGNIVPGIIGAPDKLFEARAFAYLKAQQYRLGANYRRLTANKPTKSKPLTYNRDGIGPVEDNMGATPNYFRNTYSGPVAVDDIDKSELIEITEIEGANNFDQVKEYFEKELTAAQKTELLTNLAVSLASTPAFIQAKALTTFTQISPLLSKGVKTALETLASSTSESG